MRLLVLMKNRLPIYLPRWTDDLISSTVSYCFTGFIVFVVASFVAAIFVASLPDRRDTAPRDAKHDYSARIGNGGYFERYPLTGSPQE